VASTRFDADTLCVTYIITDTYTHRVARGEQKEVSI